MTCGFVASNFELIEAGKPGRTSGIWRRGGSSQYKHGQGGRSTPQATLQGRPRVPRARAPGRRLDTSHNGSESEAVIDPKRESLGKHAQYAFLPAMAQSLEFLNDEPVNDWDHRSISFSW